MKKHMKLVTLFVLPLLCLAGCGEQSSSPDVIYSGDTLVQKSFGGLGVEWGAYEDTDKLVDGAWDRITAHMERLGAARIRLMVSYDWFCTNFDNKGTLYSFRLSDVKVGSAVNTGITGIKPLSDALSREERKVRELVKKLFGVQVTDADMEDWRSSGLSYVKTVDNETDAFVLAKFVEDEGAYERISVDYIYSSEQGMRPLLPIVGVMRSQTKALGLPPNTKVQAVALTNTIVGVINEVTDGKYTGEGKLTVWTRRK